MSNPKLVTMAIPGDPADIPLRDVPKAIAARNAELCEMSRQLTEAERDRDFWQDQLRSQEQLHAKHLDTLIEERRRANRFEAFYNHLIELCGALPGEVVDAIFCDECGAEGALRVAVGKPCAECLDTPEPDYDGMLATREEAAEASQAFGGEF